MIYVNDIPQAIKLNLLLWADDSCLMYQQKTLQKLKKYLIKISEDICDWFVDNKLSIHFGDDKTKSILFASKQRAKNIRQLNIR